MMSAVRVEIVSLSLDWWSVSMNGTIDLALLPITARDPVRGVAGNFTGEEAAQLGRRIHAGMIIPCHYEMFEFNSVSPQWFVNAAEKVGQNYTVLKCGQGVYL
jgi:L-ascorbate metabolism protein UlaG (beta-lactamase superfamily)